MTQGQKPTTLSACGKKSGGSMRKMTVIAEISVKTLVDLDMLEDLIEDVILEALHQDEEVEVKVTAEFVKVPIEPRPLRS
jgi:hypothetical protein